jgi:hypothetical protein
VEQAKPKALANRLERSPDGRVSAAFPFVFLK